MPKKIIYLFGAGASHAVVNDCNPTKGLMTSDIQTVIQNKYQNKYNFDNEVWNALIMENNDVEHLISYLEFKYDYASSNLVRKYYREAIIRLSNGFAGNPPKSNLYSVIMDMHLNIETLKSEEDLQCFISLNYEDILEKTIIKYYNRNINYNFNRNTENPTDIKVYKLHGSFNWSNDRPVSIAGRMTDVKSEKALWIPPGVDKKKENYPFNLLWGDAVEQLLNNCDILRVVGCSLNRNDWGLIPILYDIQKFNSHGKNLLIEIIDFKRTSDKIKENYKYLKVIGLDENAEIINYMNSVYGINDQTEIDSYLDSEINPMKFWIEAKLNALYSNTSIKHKKGIAYKFYNKPNL